MSERGVCICPACGCQFSDDQKAKLERAAKPRGLGQSGPWFVFVCEATGHPFKVGFEDGEYAEDRCGCTSPLHVVEVVPRSEAEALAEALEQIEGSPRAGIGCPHQQTARDALAEYRSRHPKETP